MSNPFNPTVTAAYGHRYLVWLRNSTLSTSGSTNDIVASRVQSVEPTATTTTTKYYELGSVDPTGVTSDPTQMKIVLEENLHDSKIDMYLAGVDPTTGSGYWLANMLGQTNTAFVAQRNDAGSVIGELGVGNLRVSEVQYRFVINGSCTVQYTLEGTSGSYYSSIVGAPHPVWGATSDSTIPGAVHGKDARIMFSTEGVNNKAYRLQSFTIRAVFPVQPVRELGTRQLVGMLNDVPDVTVDFDLLAADYQPVDQFYGTSSDGGITKYNLSDPQVQDVWINVYDPTLAEGASVIKSFKIQNCKPSSTMPVQARVRQLATARWTLMSTSSDQPGSAGLIVSKTEITS